MSDADRIVPWKGTPFEDEYRRLHDRILALEKQLADAPTQYELQLLRDALAAERAAHAKAEHRVQLARAGREDAIRDAQTAEGRAINAERDLAAAVLALRRVEWLHYDPMGRDVPMCPRCSGARPHHAPECPIAAVLNERGAATDPGRPTDEAAPAAWTLAVLRFDALDRIRLSAETNASASGGNSISAMAWWHVHDLARRALAGEPLTDSDKAIVETRPTAHCEMCGLALTQKEILCEDCHNDLPASERSSPAGSAPPMGDDP